MHETVQTLSLHLLHHNRTLWLSPPWETRTHKKAALSRVPDLKPGEANPATPLCRALRKDKTSKLTEKVIELHGEDDNQPEDIPAVERTHTWSSLLVPTASWRGQEQPLW